MSDGRFDFVTPRATVTSSSDGVSDMRSEDENLHRRWELEKQKADLEAKSAAAQSGGK